MKKLRLKARARLTAAYLGLFVVLGTVLVVVNYQLLASQLPSGSTSGNISVGAPQLQATHTSAVATVASAIADYRANALHTLVKASVLGLLVTAALAGLLVWLVARRALRPLHDMNATATRITEHSLDERLPVAGPPDELSELGTTFNAVLDRLEAAFAHERRLVANASHELGTPLANQRALLEVTLDDPGPSREQLLETCRTALDQNLRSQRLLSGMLTLARAEQAELARSSVDLDTVVREVVAVVRPDAVEIRTDLVPVSIEAEPFLLERLVSNLVDNAVAHGLYSEPITVTLRIDGRLAELIVSNACQPLTAESEQTLLEPFRRGRADRTGSSTGSGLGLAIVAAVAASHGWDFRLDLSEVGAFRSVLRMPLTA